MKFDDRLSTVLRDAAPTGQAAVAQYRQLVDILGQSGDTAPPQAMADGLARIHGLHPHISAAERLAAVRSLTGRLRSPVLLRYLAEDRPDIANAAVLAARLADEQWADLIPDLPIRARGFLRNRRDLGPEAQTVLAAYGPGDMRLSSDTPAAAVEAQLSAAPQGKEIGQIVARIEAFRKSRAQVEPHQLPLGDDYGPTIPAPVQSVRFQCDAHGNIVHTDPILAAIIGMSIAKLSDGVVSGVDGYAAAAFRQRMPMTGARLEIIGGPSVSGGWRIDARPQFDPQGGRFTGYSGRLRRPDASEMAGLSDTGQSDDEIRQIIHELRTPLNAILGFSEIIEQQLFGPAAQDYRAMASQIGQDARFLLAGFEDLDTALKLDGGRWQRELGIADKDWLVQRIRDRIGPLCAARGVPLLLKPDAAFFGLAIAPMDAERVILRLLSTMASLMIAPESVDIEISTDRERGIAEISINRPLTIKNAPQDSLFDPEFGLDGASGGAPLLGIGFALRLVRSLAQTHGGELLLRDDRIAVRLPHSPEMAGSPAYLSAV